MELPKRKPNRLKGYDYSKNGAYFVTICSHNNQMLFGDAGADSISARMIDTIFNKQSNNTNTSITLNMYLCQIISTQLSSLNNRIQDLGRILNPPLRQFEFTRNTLLHCVTIFKCCIVLRYKTLCTLIYQVFNYTFIITY